MEYDRTTLEKFLDFDYPDGYYAVWKTGKTLHEDSFLFGFSGAVAKYTRQGGFEDYPDWMDETNESEICIILLTEIPNVEQLSTGEF